MVLTPARCPGSIHYLLGNAKGPTEPLRDPLAGGGGVGCLLCKGLRWSLGRSNFRFTLVQRRKQKPIFGARERERYGPHSQALYGKFADESKI